MFWFLITAAFAGTIQTNNLVLENAPDWVTESMVERVVDRIQDKLEWDIRKVRAYWVSDLSVFDKKHGYGTSVTAVSFKNENAIYLSSRVTKERFEGNLGHELVHIVLFQKYKDAIPKWLEEGLANFIAKNAKADYALLKKTAIPDFRQMQHPFKKNTLGLTTEQYYMASLALAEMLASRCDLSDLLQLSVGKNLENYIQKTCEISDIQKAFSDWVKSH